MAVAIPPELATFLGTKDPAAVVIAAFRKLTEPLREIHNAVVARAGLTTITITDADPAKRGQQQATIAMKSTSRDGPAELAAKVAVAISKGKGSLYIDEARRRFKPFGLEGGSDVAEALAYAPAIRYEARNLDPITLTLIVGVAVPILVALIPGLLPTILEWGRGAFTFITNGLQSGGAGSGESAPPPPPPAGLLDLGAWTRPSPDMPAGLPPIAIAGAAAVILVLVIRKA